MSHFVKTELALSTKEHIVKALREMRFDVDMKPQGMNNGFGNVQHVDFRIKGKTIGFSKNKENYELVADWWNTGLSSEDFTRELKTKYTKHKVADVCASMHLRPGKWIEKKDGSIEMTAVKQVWV